MRLKKVLATLLAIAMLCSMLVVPASATTYSFSTSTVDTILSNIASEYSQSLSDAIKDLIYDSDYSDLLNYTSTLRSSSALGGARAFPITNADNYGTYVYDRGTRVCWGDHGCAGCMAYAAFFSYSVYGTFGTTPSYSVTLSSGSEAALEAYLDAYVQPGEHLRSKDRPHSVIYLGKGTENGQEGFYIAEYWGGASNATGSYVYYAQNDQLYIKFYSYSDFVTKYSGKTWFVYEAYETSEYANETSGSTGSTSGSTSSDASRDIVMVIDTSTSMRGDKLTYTKQAAIQFVNEILSTSSNTRISIVKYGNYSSTVIDLTNDADALIAAIESLTLSGSTNMYGGLEEAGDILSSSTADKKAIVIMTDGVANRGTTSTAQTIETAEGDSVYFTKYGAAIYDLAQTYINEGYTIYSLGFGLTENSDAYNLIKYISSFSPSNTRYFWSVTADNISDIVFTYEDIAGTISTSKSIVIAIECPVDVTISYEGETLSRSNTTTSFGSVTVTEASDGYKYLFALDYHDDYDINIQGLDNGYMDFVITYVKGDETDVRGFLNVPITVDTEITTTYTDSRADFLLYIDEDGDGDIDLGYSASVNETVTVPDSDILEELYPTSSIADEDGTYVYTYTISTDASVGGAIAVVSSADANDTVSVAVTADTGYALSEVTVTATDGTSVELTEVSTGNYTFVMPESNVTVTAVFTETQTSDPGTTIHIHTPGKAVRENSVEATATTDGSYDLVIYCAECGKEISRSYVTIPAYGTSTTVVTDADNDDTASEEVVIDEPIEPTDTDTEDDSELDNTDTTQAETSSESNPITGIAISLVPMAIAALAAVSSKRR